MPSDTESQPEDSEQLSKLLVLYASQTGTAEDVAQSIARHARRRHYPSRVCAVDEYSLEDLLEEPIIIFVTATTGQGDEPANMKRFWKFLLRADLPTDLFEHLLYAIFGLGDSSYPKFNWPAKKLDRRLNDLGGHAFYERGDADDQDYLGIDTVLDKWMDGLWKALAAVFPPISDAPPIPLHVLPSPRLKIHFSDMANGHSTNAASCTSQLKNLRLEDGTIKCTITRNERATSKDHFQDTRYFEMQADSDMEYNPGDVAELRPENLSANVEKFIELMHWREQADVSMEIQPANDDWPIPSSWPRRTTLRELLTKHLDIFSVPRRSFFETLAYFTSNQEETDKLREFASSQGQEDLWDYALRPKRTIYEVLTEFKSAKIPFEYVADVFPEIRPRQFSIASCSALHPREIHLLVAIVNYKTIMHKPRRGICTSWMSELSQGAQISVKIIHGTMTIPPKDRPAIFIGPGTGIAPFRAYAEYRMLQQATETLVVFGCRSAKSDFYYKTEWEAAKDSGGTKFLLAASRDQPDKVYVQHKIVEHGDEIWRLVDAGASIYVSGSANQMPNSVKKALRTVFQSKGGMSEAAASAFFEKLELTHRYQEETWS